MSWPLQFGGRVLRRLRREVIGPFAERNAGCFGQRGRDPRGIVGMGVDPGADGGAAEGKFEQSGFGRP